MRKNRKVIFVTLGLAFSLAQAATLLGQERTVYHTDFEAEQDFDIEFALLGQGGWEGEGSGGTGLVEENFEGMGQQAYLGYWPPTEKSEKFTSLWQSAKGIEPEESRVTVTLVMMIVDSTNNQRDDFRWILYNDTVQRLMTIDFDNETRNINYALDNDDFLPTGYSFEPEALYDLKFVMDFSANTWTFFVGEEIIVNEQKLTTKDARLAFGDLGPSWVYRKPESPGDNYIVFDDYRITVERSAEAPKSPPKLAWAGWTDEGAALMKLDGDATSEYTIEYSTNLKTWKTPKIVQPVETSTNIEDIESPKQKQRFYRAQTAD